MTWRVVSLLTSHWPAKLLSSGAAFAGWEALLLAKLPALSTAAMVWPLTQHRGRTEGTAHHGMPAAVCVRGSTGGSQRQALKSCAGPSNKVDIGWLCLSGHIYPMALSSNSPDCLERRDSFPSVHLHKIEKAHFFHSSAKISRLCPSEMLVLKQLSALEWI